MGKHNRVPRGAALATAVAGAMLGLAVLLASLAGGTTWAAPLRAGSGNDPHIAAITLTADLPISDTRPGDGLDKTVYFSNSAPGVMTLTFEISGTPTLTLAAGAAFDTPTGVYTSDDSPWIQIVTYSVAATHTHQPNVAYTAINTDAQATTVTITYVQDITAPTTIIVHPPPGYFTGTQLVITGTASDDAGGAGVQWVYVMTEMTWMTATGTTDWAYTATFPITDGVPYTLSARAIDFLGTVGAGVTRAITVDNVPPRNPSSLASSVPTATWKNVSAIPVTWTAGSDGSGGLVYYYALTTTWPYTVGAGSPFTTALAVTPTLAVDGVYTFALRSLDGAGNWATDTSYLGPFFKDGISPAVTIMLPAAHSLLTTTHLPTCTIGGIASDPHPSSGLAVVSVTTGLAWYTATGTDVWAYTWTLPITDDVVYALTARAGDNAGNLGESPAVTVTVDTVAPSAAVPSPHRSPWVTSTVVYTWPHSYDNADIVGYRVNITNTQGYTHFIFTPGPALTFTQAVSEGAGYTARVRAVDGNWNEGGWGDASTVITPDLTPPVIIAPSISKGTEPSGSRMFIDGLRLYYRNDSGLNASFSVQGYLSDTLSGGQESVATRAFQSGPYTSTDTYPAAYQFPYQIPGAAEESSTITVTGRDKAGNLVMQVYTYTYDGTPPTSTAWAPSFAITRPITVTWAATDTQSGVYSTTLWYKKEVTGTWTPYQTYTAASGVFTFTPPAGDGLYLFATVSADRLGNLEAVPTLSETQTIYDATPPVNVIITAPRHISATQFMVSWSAEDATSGVASYTVAYSNTTTSSWQNWLTETTATSGMFQAPTVESDYVFRVMAYDRAGNSAMATVTTRVGAFRVYIPLVLRNWAWWYQYDTYEPNNTRAQAYGPLIAGRVYTSYIYTADDQFDFYTMTVPSAVGQIVLDLVVPDCCDYDLYLYNAPTGSYIAASNYTGKGLDEHIIYNNLQAGRYYILVYSPYRDHSNAAPYSLQWNTP